MVRNSPHRSGRGGTHVEMQLQTPPRLFTTLSGAKNCLNFWLAGTLSRTWNLGVDEQLKLTPQQHRKASEMRIVQVSLTIEDSLS
jgi:hypothetical protein